MDLRLYNITLEDFQFNANLVKDCLFSTLIEDGILTESQAEKYVVVVNKKGMWGTLLEKLWKSTDSITFKVIRLK
jgi:hypothetical protein